MSHVKFEFHTNQDLLTYFIVKNRSTSFSAYMVSKLYRHLRFGTHTYIVSVLTPTDFRHGPLVDKNTRKRMSVELPASEKFSGHFLYLF